MPRRSLFGRPRLLTAVAVAALVLFLIGPVLRLAWVGAAEGSPAAWSDPALWTSVLLTMGTASVATALAATLGLPLAYLLARRRFPGRTVLLGLLELPMVIPHPVAGIGLLLFLGRHTPAGTALASLGLEVVNSPVGIVAAMLFVSVPILIDQARVAFESVDPMLERAARSLGDRPSDTFTRITLPLALRGIVSGAILTWARAVSEFGAIVIIAYNPQVASTFIYDRFTVAGLEGAVPAAVVLLVVALGVLVLLRALAPRDAR